MTTKKLLIAVIALSIALVSVVGVTIAFLVDSQSVKNTFTYGDINIALEETPDTFKMIPGDYILKDPTVTVEGGSEVCWLFVKIEESDNFDDFMTYNVDTAVWNELKVDGVAIPGVYYLELDEVYGETYFEDGVVKSDIDIPVLKKYENANKEIYVLDTVTKEDLNAADFVAPTLTFTAYAVQKANVNDVKTAWSIAEASANS